MIVASGAPTPTLAVPETVVDVDELPGGMLSSVPLVGAVIVTAS